MEETLIEIPTVRWFAEIDAITDESMILNFRHPLEKHNLVEAIFGPVKARLSKRGMRMRLEAIVNATLIATPNSKSKEC